MTNFLNVILALILAALGVAAYFLFALKRKSEKPQDDQTLKVMMEWMKEIKAGTENTKSAMEKSLSETNKAINERLDNAGRVIASLTRELGGMAQIGPDIRRLSEVLASPKSRGNFGEEILEELLSQVLPKNSYAIQYRFKNGETVDAIVRVGERILPIDSKFSMENFRLLKEAKTDEAAEGLKKNFLRDVKKRVEEIHKKYILPQENTFDFALMYIPSEAVFSEILDDINTISNAREKKVYFVSPNTLYHHLQVILLSLRGQKINEAAQQILAAISGIRQESDKFGRNLEILANHLKNAGNTMGLVGNDFQKLKNSIHNASSLKLEAVRDSEPKKLLDPEN
mgnify:FL=1